MKVIKKELKRTLSTVNKESKNPEMVTVTKKTGLNAGKKSYEYPDPRGKEADPVKFTKTGTGSRGQHDWMMENSKKQTPKSAQSKKK